MVATRRWMGALLVALVVVSPGALANGGNIWIGANSGHFGFSLALPTHHDYQTYSHYDYPSYYYGQHHYGHSNYGYGGRGGHGAYQNCYWRYGHKHCYRTRH